MNTSLYYYPRDIYIIPLLYDETRFNLSEPMYYHLTGPTKSLCNTSGLRWDIEVYFKMCKSFLKLAKEIQGRSYDSMFAHTTIVCLRYLLLSIENREGKDNRALGGLFYACCDEVEDISFNQAFLLITNLLTKTLRDVALLPEEVINQIIEKFMEELPDFVTTRLFRQAA